MEKKIIRSIVIILTVLAQVSFWPTVFGKNFVPALVLSLVISWIFIAGFAASLGWIIFAGVMLDIFSFAALGTNVILLTTVGYGVSFLSRRFILEHKTWGSLLIFSFIILSAAVYYFLNIFLQDWHYFFDVKFWRSQSFLFSSAMQIFITMALSFVLVYFPMKKIENFIAFYDRRAGFMK